MAERRRTQHSLIWWRATANVLEAQCEPCSAARSTGFDPWWRGSAVTKPRPYQYGACSRLLAAGNSCFPLLGQGVPDTGLRPRDFHRCRWVEAVIGLGADTSCGAEGLVGTLANSRVLVLIRMALVGSRGMGGTLSSSFDPQRCFIPSGHADALIFKLRFVSSLQKQAVQ